MTSRSSSSGSGSSADSSPAVVIAQILNAAHRRSAVGNTAGLLEALTAAQNFFFAEPAKHNEPAKDPRSAAAEPAESSQQPAVASSGLRLMPEYAPEMLNRVFLRHSDARVRKFVVQFCEGVVKRLPQMVGAVLPAYEALADDPERAVCVRVISGMTNTILPAVVRFIAGTAGTEASPAPAPADVVSAWEGVERFTEKAVDLFQNSKAKPVQGATVQFLQAMVVAISRPTDEDEEFAIVSGNAPKSASGAEPPPSIFHAEINGTLPPEISLTALEARADVYIQMLEMRLDDLWQLCLSQLKLIAAARTEKRLRIINSFAAFAGVGSGASAQKKPPTVAMKSILKANLIQLWKCLVHPTDVSRRDEKAIMDLLSELGATGAEIQKHRVTVTRTLDQKRSSLGRLRKHREAERARKAAAKAAMSSADGGPAAKRARRGPPWQARNIVSMAQVETLPLHILIELFLANLSNVSSAPPTDEDFAFVQAPPKAVEDQRTAFDRFAERGPRKVHERNGASIESPEYFMAMRKLLFRQLLLQGTVVTATVGLLSVEMPAVTDAGYTASTGDLWAQLVARLAWLLRDSGSLGTSPGGLLHFIRSRLLPEGMGTGTQTKSDNYRARQQEQRERMAVQLFLQVAHLALHSNGNSTPAAVEIDSKSSALVQVSDGVGSGDDNATHVDYSAYNTWVMQALSQPLGAAAYLALLRGLPSLNAEAVEYVLADMDGGATVLKSPASSAADDAAAASTMGTQAGKNGWTEAEFSIVLKHLLNGRWRIRRRCFSQLLQFSGSANEALHKAALRLLAEKLYEEEADLSEEEDEDEVDDKDAERKRAATAAQSQGSLLWPELLASRRVLARIVAFSGERRRELETYVVSETDGGATSTDNATSAASVGKTRGQDDGDEDDDDDEFMDDENAGTGDVKLDAKLRFLSLSSLLLSAPDVRAAADHLLSLLVTFGKAPPTVQNALLSVGTVKRYLVTDDLPRLLTICLQRASSPSTPLQTQQQVAAGLPLLHAVWIHMADRVMFRSEEATEARDTARKAAGTSDEPIPEDEPAAAAEKAAEEYVKIAEQVAGGVGAILRAVGELPTSGDATATGADPESTAPSDTPRKQVTSAAFLVPVAARMPLPRMRAWLPRLLVAAVTEVGSDLPDVAQSAMTSNSAILRSSLFSITLASALTHAPPPPPPAPAEPLLGAAAAAAKAERAAVLAAAAVDPNILMTTDLLLSLHRAGEAAGPAGEAAVAAATALRPSPAAAVPPHVYRVCFMTDHLMLDEHEIADVMRRLCTMQDLPPNTLPRFAVRTLLHAAQAFHGTPLAVASALLVDLVRRKFWASRHGTGMWEDFIDFIIAVSKIPPVLTTVTTAAGATVTTAGQSPVVDFVFPAAVYLPCAKAEALCADPRLQAAVPTFLSDMRTWFAHRPAHVGHRMDPALADFLRQQ